MDTIQCRTTISLIWLICSLFPLSESSTENPISHDYWLGEDAYLQSYIRDSPPIGGPEEYLNLKENRMDLSDRPKLSIGPRKRSTGPYLDPLFKIPLASAPPSFQYEQLKSGDFCAQVDCWIFVEHDCCNGIRRSDTRTLPIGPMVQPTLLENWSSSFLAFWMENPPLFYFMKTIGLVLGALAWGWLGVHFLSDDAKLSSRSDVDGMADLTQKVILALESGAPWIEQLEDYVAKNKKAFRDVSQFLCCFFDEEQNEIGGKRTPRGYLRCSPSRSSVKKLSQHSFSCVSNLLYNVSLNQEN